MLVKALPHVGDKHGETICCAGVTLDRQWRRQFPITFRYLENQKFSRWQWIEYRWRKPTDDKRPESQRVQDGTIIPGPKMPKRERANFLNPLVVASTSEAADSSKTLALIRPENPVFSFKKKRADKIDNERRDYAAAASQLSFFTKQQKPLEPCPYEFRFKYTTKDGPHDHLCGDWETAAMYFRFEKLYGVKKALKLMDETFNLEYPKNGMVFAMGTDSRYPSKWLLVGVIRLDEEDQIPLL